MNRSLSSLAALLLALSASACGSGPRPLVAGEDSCRYCRMTIDDPRFGAMVLTSRGRIETFDSIECLAGYVGALAPASTPRAIWVADVEHPSRWLDVSHARFVSGGTLHSPMGRKLVAVDEAADVDGVRQRLGGELLSWTQVLAMVTQQAVPSAPTAPHAHAPQTLQ
jgi:copper chaperone NosL